MASIVKYDGGLKRIEFSLVPNGPRKMVRLGRVSMKVAGEWQAKIAAIIADKLLGRAHEPTLAEWLGSLDETILRRLRAVGLADGVGLAQATVGEFLDRYFAAMTLKRGTRLFYGHTRANMEDFFGKGKALRAI